MRLTIDEGRQSRDLTEAELAGMARFEVLVTEVDDDGQAVALTPDEVLAAEALLYRRMRALEPAEGARVRVPGLVEQVSAAGTIGVIEVERHDRARAHLAAVGRVAALLREVDEEARVACALAVYRAGVDAEEQS